MKLVIIYNAGGASRKEDDKELSPAALLPWKAATHPLRYNCRDQTTVADGPPPPPMSSTLKKYRSPVVVSLGCGCRGSRSILSGKQRPTSLREYLSGSRRSFATKESTYDDLGPSISSSETFALAKSFSDECSVTTDADDDNDNGEQNVPGGSFSDLLRQLGELEQSLHSWPVKKKNAPSPPETIPSSSPPPPNRLPSKPQPGEVKGRPGGHRQTKSARRVGESVAVVKASEDPLSDFRWSMIQMIVEKEIVAVDDLRDLLHCFLSLNSPHHHDVILRAFLDVWDDLFSSPDHHRHHQQEGGATIGSSNCPFAHHCL
uniref:Transcription repressor n=2 Tax=Nymphaea colorata TaxID=210225 RepID=A0A5K1CTS3_9MAGN